VLCDDGSTDGTRELAEEAIRNCDAAIGVVLEGGHQGKSTALNMALAYCDTEYVVRIDSDCLVDEDAFVYAIPWLQTYREVGIVGSFVLPKKPFTTWIDRMRCFEVGTGFELRRLAWTVIDGTPCIPGQFTAFRRKLALAIGGFTEGMYGEDVDFTCNVARLGYRSVYDRRIWSYEDVPGSIPQLRLQRLRWNRGGVQNYARFVPFASGFAGPRFWFTAFIRTGRRLIRPLSIPVLAFLIEGYFLDGSYFHISALQIMVVYAISRTPALFITALSMIYWRIPRTLFWLPLVVVFSFVKLLANVEANLTFPSRPVTWPWKWCVRRGPMLVVPSGEPSDTPAIAS
jgi:cellulose synthase/poly-beta-1,6-N-acetylglucosamine synthase-like glycosyltransferase